MQVPTFLLERNQTLYENTVEINLTESGVHPATITDILDEAEIGEMLRLPLGYGHTDGTPALRRSIADWHPGAGAENVVVAHGSSEANLLALAALADPGDEIVMIVPNFMQLDGLARALDLTVRQVALRPENGWQPDAEEVKAAITSRTRLITLCDPNNPTGVVMTPDSRRALAELADRCGVWLLIDEIYRGSEIDEEPSATAYGLGERVVVSGGLSKSFGCPGLRMGWLVAPAELVAECHRRQDYTTIGTGPLAQYLALKALAAPVRERLLARGRGILAGGRERVAQWIAGHNGWSWVRPQASGMAFMRYGLEMESESVVRALREEEGVFVCAGSWFGLEGHIRVGFGVAPHHLEEGLGRLDRFLQRRG